MFADRSNIVIVSGKGGDGHVSFRREKYVPDGGPDGGDGGHGGDIIFEINESLNTLTDYRHKHKYVATSGEEGGKKNCHGKSGENLILKVPAGTILREANTGKIIADMSGDNKRQRVLTGGKGGKGNMNYATPTMQAPKYAQPGQQSQTLDILMELKVIADVGLVGFPNVGKSTLLARVTNARPKIANYHFTTLSPNLGVVDLEDGTGFVIADIPGLIEGAADGIGLGHEFLRHIERTKVIIHMVDAASTEGRDPIADIHAINKELEAYNPSLLKKPQVIAANKMDAIYGESNEIIDALKAEFENDDMKVFPISAVSGQGIRELLFHVNGLLSKVQREPIVFEREFFAEDLGKREDGIVVEYDQSEKEYVVSGPTVERMLGYTNMESEKGFLFFQNFLRDKGILKQLEALGVQEGDTIRLYGLSFEYYK